MRFSGVLLLSTVAFGAPHQPAEPQRCLREELSHTLDGVGLPPPPLLPLTPRLEEAAPARAADATTASHYFKSYRRPLGGEQGEEASGGNASNDSERRSGNTSNGDASSDDVSHDGSTNDGRSNAGVSRSDAFSDGASISDALVPLLGGPPAFDLTTATADSSITEVAAGGKHRAVESADSVGGPPAAANGKTPAKAKKALATVALKDQQQTKPAEPHPAKEAGGVKVGPAALVSGLAGSIAKRVIIFTNSRKRSTTTH